MRIIDENDFVICFKNEPGKYKYTRISFWDKRLRYKTQCKKMIIDEEFDYIQKQYKYQALASTKIIDFEHVNPIVDLLVDFRYDIDAVVSKTRKDICLISHIQERLPNYIEEIKKQIQLNNDFLKQLNK